MLTNSVKGIKSLDGCQSPPCGRLGGDGGCSLDKYRSSSKITNENGSFCHRSEWSRSQKRGYHRSMTMMHYWQSNGYQVLWICLTGAVESVSKRLAYDHGLLRSQVCRSFGFEGIEHFQVRTSEGNGVLHVLWAWKPADGMRKRRFWIPQRWLSEQWLRLHGASIVWIKKVSVVQESAGRKISRYCISQYCGEQSGYEYMSWSWHRSFGFPMVACWRWLKRMARYNRPRLLYWWHRLMAGEALVVYFRQSSSSSVLRLDGIRGLYQEFGSELWEFT